MGECTVVAVINADGNPVTLVFTIRECDVNKRGLDTVVMKHIGDITNTDVDRRDVTFHCEL